MSSVEVFPFVVLPPMFTQAMVTVKADKDAERIAIYDRRNLMLITTSNNVPSNIVKIRVPLEFSTSNNLLVGILDDDLTYNAKFLDGRQADLINGNQVTIRP
ncbi:hypothetical protein ACE02Z_16085 [Shewanella xiamenensis]|uniref:hypothetical protein n=1 Tax=Shewanella xiamenensis TaxID=332186 RepID=UPI00313D5049